MASVEQCEAALLELARRLDEYPHEARRDRIPDRTVELALLDLDVSFHAHLRDGQLVDIQQGSIHKPNIRLTMSSDDLMDLTDKRLRFTQAWASGRIHLDASLRDLLRLRSLI